MDNRTLSELIGLIYEVATEVDLWPRLLEILSVELLSVLPAESIGTSNSIVSQDSKGETSISEINHFKGPSHVDQALFELLRSHLTRALKLSHRIYSAQQERNAMEELLERLPLGMMVVDSDSRIVDYNRRLDQIISGRKGISVYNSILSANSSRDTTKLRQRIRAVADGDKPETETMNLPRSDTALPLSVLIIPFKTGANLGTVKKNQVILLIAAPEILLDVPKETLMSLYHLTAAEARLVSSLVRDRDLNSIADDFGISKHTIRTQLKSVYEKTGTHRQAELVRQVITGPALLANISRNRENVIDSQSDDTDSPSASQTESLHQTMRLPDARQLGFSEYGLKDGHPVIFMHEMVGSRLQDHLDGKIIEKHGVRLITPDRPGVGLSDAKKNLSLLGYADDIEHLADHLRFDRFSIVGNSAGCVFALACAYKLQQRISRLVLASSMAPFSSIWDLEGTSSAYRLILSLGKFAPSLLMPLVRLIGLQRKPEMFFDEMLKQMSPLDQALLNNPQHRDGMIAMMKENLKQGEHHVAQELHLLTSDWGFEPGQIQTPIELWHGESDRIVPQRIVKKLAEELPNCRTNFITGAGHYLFLYCWEEILKAAN